MFLPMYSTVHAGTTGKITGQVTDREGNPLPGASVVIKGTRRGTEADEEGFYVLLSVEPGLHTLVASMVGFRSEPKEGVVVSSDFTTNASFELKEEALELGEVVVTAERGRGGWGMLGVRGDAPPVEPDRTTTIYRVTDSDTKASPNVRSILGFIELQPGVTLDAGGNTLTVRAGDPEDVAYYIDGVPVPSTDHIETRVYRNFNRTAIQELTVVTGGLDAEYGNAQGGIVRVVSQEGGQTYRGLMDYEFAPPGKKHWGKNVYDSPIHRGNARWDDPDWVGETVTLPDGRVAQAHRRLDYTGVSGHFVEGSLSGPLARDMGFLAGGKWRRQPSVFPGPHLTTPFNINLSLKLTYRASQKVKLNLGGWYDRRKGAFRGNTSEGMLDLREDGKNLFLADPDPAGTFYDTDYMFYGAVTHLLSPNTFYEIRVSLSASKRDTAGVRLPPGAAHISEAVSGDPVRDKMAYYTVYRDVVDWERFSRNRLTVKADLSRQFNRKHFLKTGFEMIRYSNRYQQYSSAGPDLRFVGWYARTYKDTDFFPDQHNKGVNPLQLGVYAQDKIEMDGMVMNAGVRLDFLFQNTCVTDIAYYGPLSPMWNSMTRNRHAPTVRAPTFRSFSPRLGIAHPVTEQSVLRFFYGRFTQLPGFKHLYFNSWHSTVPQDSDLNANGAIDSAERWNTFSSVGTSAISPSSSTHHNPYLPSEETTSFELGLDWNFVRDYVLGITAYYKHSDNQMTTVQKVWDEAGASVATPGVVVISVPGVFRDARGFELNVKKRFSQMLAFSFALNLQWADEGSGAPMYWVSVYDSLFVANGHFWVQYDVDPATGAEIPVPLREMAVREGKAPEYYTQHFGLAAANDVREYLVVLVRGEGYFTVVPWASHFATGGSFQQITGRLLYTGRDGEFWERVNSTAGHPGGGEGEIYVLSAVQAVRDLAPSSLDRRAFGSLTLLLATPARFGPLNGRVLGNVRANLIYRFYTGTPFDYERTGPIGIVASTRHGPMHTRTDLHLEKRLPLSARVELALGVEVYNLFNQRDVRSVSPEQGRDIDYSGKRWQLWGIEGFDPLPSASGPAAYSEINDINNYWDQPREFRFGLQMRW